MLKKISFALCLLTGSAFAQTGSLVGHAVGTVDGSPTSTVVLTGATTANALIVITDKVDGVVDSDGHTFVKQSDTQGYDTWTQVWTAYGITVSSSDTITVNGNYNGTKPLALAFSNIASFDKFQSFGNTNTNDNPIKAGPITPSNPNELIIGITAGTFNTPPTRNVSTSTPSGWSQVDADNTLGTAFADYILTEGSGTPAATTFSVSDNSNNGHMAAILALTTTASPLPLQISPSTLPHGMRTAAYPITANNLSGPYAPTCITPAFGTAPYTVAITGTLPPGLSMGPAPDFCITGTPTTSGTYSGLVFTATDHAGATASTPSMSIVIDPLLTTVDLGGPRYGFVVFPGAVRHPGAVETNPGATGKINWSVSDSSKGTLSCTTNCVGTVTVTATGTAGTCSVAGSVGHYSIVGGNDFTVTATSADQNEDGSYSSDSETYHICKGDHLVDVQPAYNQSFFGQQKHFYSYVLGQIPQDVTWSCIAPDSSSCDAALDVDLPSGSGPGTKRHNRDVAVTGPSSVVGSYKIIATSPSDYDGTTASNYAWDYVGGALTTAHTGTTALPVSPDGTEVQACFPDPRFTTSWMVKKDGTGDFVHPWQAPTDQAADQNSGGYLMRIFNQDTTGSAPTQYPDYWYITRGGTRDLPTVVCGVPDASGHLPIIQRQGATTSGRDEGVFGTGFAGNIISVQPRIGSPIGYDTSSNVDFVNVWGLNFIDSSHTSDARAVEVAPGGRHIAMEGVHTDYMMDGALWNNNTNYSGTHSSSFSSVIGSYFQHCGAAGDTGNHCLYLEGMYTQIADSKFQDTIEGAGLANKIRGGGSIVAFNSYVGEFGYPEIDYEAMTDDAPFTSVEINLGAIGDTNCGDSAYCNIMANGGDENWLHIADNEQALASAYSYGNIYSTTSGSAYTVIAYGVMNANACNAATLEVCTTGVDHVGGFHLWNSTFDREGGAQVGSEGVFYNSGYDGKPMRTWPWIWMQNNSMFNAGAAPDGTPPPPFQLFQSPYGMGGFKNNLIASGSVDLSSPIVAGHTGWPTETRLRPPWTAYETKDSYLTGMNTFITASSIPYDTTTFRPTANSPLNSAGAPIVDPLMSILPLRYESDPVGGFVIPRTDNGATIGARSYSASAFVLTVNTTTIPAGTVGIPYSFTLSASSGTGPYTWTKTGMLPAGLSLNSSTGVISGTPTTAGTTTGLTFTVTDSTSATASSGSMSLVINPSGVVTPLSVGTTTLPGGVLNSTYPSTQLVANGGRAPYTWVQTSGATFPSGLTVVSNGTISGIPTAAGTYSGIIFRVTDADGSTANSGTLSITITGALPARSTRNVAQRNIITR